MNIIDKIIKNKGELSYEEAQAMDNFMRPLYVMETEQELIHNKKTGHKNTLILNNAYTKQQLRQVHHLLRVNFYGSRLKKNELEAELAYCKVIVKAKGMK